MDIAESDLRTLLTTALKQRNACEGAKDAVAELSRVQASLPDGWRARTLSELAFHAHRAFGASRNDADRQASRELAREAVTLTTHVDDPLLTAFALREQWIVDHDAPSIDAMLEALTAIEQVDPTVDNWAISPRRVHGMLAVAVSRELRRQARFDDCFRLLEHHRRLRKVGSSPAPTQHWTCQLYRQTIMALRDSFRESDESVVLAELLDRVPELGQSAVSMYERLRGASARRRGQWSVSIDAGRKAFAATSNKVIGGNIANDVADGMLRTKQISEATDWLQRANDLWDVVFCPGRGTTGRLTTAQRHSWMMCHLLGDWSAGLASMVSVVNAYPDDDAIGGAVTNLLELLSDFQRIGRPKAELQSLGLVRGSLTCTLDDIETLVGLAMRTAPLEGHLTSARAATAAAELVAAAWCADSDDVRRALINAIAYLEGAGNWWRAGRAHLAMARLLEREDVLRAAEHAESGIAAWSRHRSQVARAADETWLAENERDGYLFAWRLAVRADSPTFAEMVAENLRGSVLLALLSADQDTFDRIAELARARDSVSGVGGEAGSAADDGDDEEPSEGSAPETRAAQQVVAARRADELTEELGDLAQLVPGSGRPLLDGETSGDWFLWVEITESEVLSTLRTDVGSFAGVHRLSTNARDVIRSLSDEVQAARVAENGRVGLAQALAEIGDAIVPATCRERLLSCHPDEPVRIDICPGERGWTIPWSAVTVGGRRLIEHAAVALVPSFSWARVLSLRQGRPEGGPQMIRDEHLPGTQVEVDALCALWPAVQPLDDPGERTDWSSANMLVVSVHGALEGGGLDQTLRFPRRDISARELLAWRFPALTVMGSCWVGRVDATAGGDPLGVLFPVLVRGGRVFVGGQFPVQDEATGEILRAVYGLVHDGVAPVDALRTVQRDYLRAHPDAPLGAWAGLVAHGLHGDL